MILLDLAIGALFFGGMASVLATIVYANKFHRRWEEEKDLGILSIPNKSWKYALLSNEISVELLYFRNKHRQSLRIFFICCAVMLILLSLNWVIRPH